MQSTFPEFILNNRKVFTVYETLHYGKKKRNTIYKVAMQIQKHKILDWMKICFSIV